ncbi:hypothetical protein RN001_013703 [Aquatica leii]|uniref:DUF7041 domain-containing protein n=1 Tax=Aquatica leii TaxID=1421715 RepID=A0AAN7P362_9COLE|nr:hypothetical protein RN001_013703 [Aquatica leii]
MAEEAEVVQVAPTTQIAATTVTLPPFWGNKVELWFVMAEAKFNLASPKITREETKFYHVISVLPPEIAGEVSDIITEPPGDKPYTNLKKAIIARTSLTETQKLKQLLVGQELGDRKPSQLLRHMKSLVNTQAIDEKIIKELFLQQMPVSIQPILVSLTLGLEQLAEVADKIIETTPSAIAPVTFQPETHPTTATISTRPRASTNNHTKRSTKWRRNIG